MNANCVIVLSMMMITPDDPRPRALSEDAEADEDLDGPEDQEEGAPGGEVGEEQATFVMAK